MKKKLLLCMFLLLSAKACQGSFFAEIGLSIDSAENYQNSKTFLQRHDIQEIESCSLLEVVMKAEAFYNEANLNTENLINVKKTVQIVTELSIAQQKTEQQLINFLVLEKEMMKEVEYLQGIFGELTEENQQGALFVLQHYNTFFKSMAERFPENAYGLLREQALYIAGVINAMTNAHKARQLFAVLLPSILSLFTAAPAIIASNRTASQ